MLSVALLPAHGYAASAQSCGYCCGATGCSGCSAGQNGFSSYGTLKDCQERCAGNKAGTFGLEYGLGVPGLSASIICQAPDRTTFAAPQGFAYVQSPFYMCAYNGGSVSRCGAWNGTTPPSCTTTALTIAPAAPASVAPLPPSYCCGALGCNQCDGSDARFPLHTSLAACKASCPKPAVESIPFYVQQFGAAPDTSTYHVCCAPTGPVNPSLLTPGLGSYTIVPPQTKQQWIDALDTSSASPLVQKNDYYLSCLRNGGRHTAFTIAPKPYDPTHPLGTESALEELNRRSQEFCGAPVPSGTPVMQYIGCCKKAPATSPTPNGKIFSVGGFADPWGVFGEDLNQFGTACRAEEGTMVRFQKTNNIIALGQAMRAQYEACTGDVSVITCPAPGKAQACCTKGGPIFLNQDPPPSQGQGGGFMGFSMKNSDEPSPALAQLGSTAAAPVAYPNRTAYATCAAATGAVTREYNPADSASVLDAMATQCSTSSAPTVWGCCVPGEKQIFLPFASSAAGGDTSTVDGFTVVRDDDETDSCFEESDARAQVWSRDPSSSQLSAFAQACNTGSSSSEDEDPFTIGDALMNDAISSESFEDNGSSSSRSYLQCNKALGAVSQCTSTSLSRADPFATLFADPWTADTCSETCSALQTIVSCCVPSEGCVATSVGQCKVQAGLVPVSYANGGSALCEEVCPLF